MTALHQSVCGVPLVAETDDPRKAERVRRVLLKAMELLDRQRVRSPRRAFEAVLGRRP